METALEIIRELTKDEGVMWVVGRGDVVSENDSKGIKEPEVENGYMTIEADNWHFHIGVDAITGVQFVEAESHEDLISYYVRFSNEKEETLVRGYFPNPHMDSEHKRTEFQPEKYRVFEEMRDRFIDNDAIVFVKRPRNPNG
jgi:hypothetical protein